MPTKELSGSPGMLGLYVRAALGAVPVVSSLPIVGGRGKEIPDTALELTGVTVDREHLGGYARVCGFPLRDSLPPTYPHILAFPLHLRLMTDRRFPFPVMGVVHIANRITQHRSLHATEPLDIRVSATKLEPHPKGRQFSLITEVRSNGELVWEGVSTNLRRGAGSNGGGPKDRDDPTALGEEARWTVPADTGRRYASASGDRNPIHMHDLSAKAFGFPRAIAHGMWTKARALAELGDRVPDDFTVHVRFGKPMLLPAKVVFATAERKGGGTRFAVRAKDGAPHAQGEVIPG